MALWDKGYEIDPEVLRYTVGRDFIVDSKLVPYDCRASAAHAKMLRAIGILNQDEFRCGEKRTLSHNRNNIGHL